MKLKLFIILIIYACLLFRPSTLQADDSTKRELEALSSRVRAQDARKSHERQLNFRIQKVQEFLANYPLVVSSKDLVLIADRLDLDYRLLPAISMVESTGCKFIPLNSYNCWGWQRGRAQFTSFSDGAWAVAQGLIKDYDYKDIRATAYRYCPPNDCNTEAWIRNVTNLMDRI